MILENGVVRTMDSALPLARALAIAADRVAGGVGTHETALPSPEVVDLRGRCVLPAFTDSHVHFPTWSLAQRDVRLEGVERLAEALERVRAHPRHGDWIRGTGWRSAEWDSQPTKEALDEVTGSTPAALWAKDYHSLWLNSAALALARGDLEIEGGVVERDKDGEPTGVLREESAWHFRERFGAVSEDEWVEATLAGMRLAATRGVAAVHDKDGWLGAAGIFQRIAGQEGLSLRVWQSVPYERLPELESLGVRSGIGDQFLRIGYLKVFMDGTLGSQTAWMLDGSGVRITSGEHLQEIIRDAARAGWPVGVHAIGDRANREALDAFEATRDDWAPRGLRQRIEHAQCLAREDVARFASIGVACSVQFSHAPSDRDLADRFWGERAELAYAFRSLWDSGALVANGSDAPVEELDPLAGIRAGVLRTIDDRPAWHPEQALAMEQVLLAATVNSAWLARDERSRGKLLPGFLADLVVLNRDPLACPADELETIEVVATMVGGRWVHNPPPWD
ncbi:MAG: amidohydrolase [Actinobacteria bacterium]|nr:amidohydrolase [Actinomycetota bacterium]